MTSPHRRRTDNPQRRSSDHPHQRALIGNGRIDFQYEHQNMLMFLGWLAGVVSSQAKSGFGASDVKVIWPHGYDHPQITVQLDNSRFYEISIREPL